MSDKLQGTLLSKFIRSLQEGGYVWEYFEEDGGFGERDLRGKFKCFHACAPKDWSQEKLIPAAKGLLKAYGVQRTFPKKLVPNLCARIIEALKQGKIDNGDLLRTPEIAEALAECFNGIIKEFGDDGDYPRPPISFTSKLLHFLRPNQFVMVDAYAQSCWILVRKKLGWGKNSSRDKLKDFYKGALDFYIKLWDIFSEKERTEIDKAIFAITKTFQLDFLTPLDAMDKYFWTAYGHALENEIFGS